MSEQQNTYVHYFYLADDDIHHIIYQAVSRDAVDEFMDLFDMMLKTTPVDGTIRLIVDNHVNDQPQPLSYMLQKIRSLISSFPQRPAVRVAIVYEQRNQFFSFVDMIMQMFARGQDKLRYFKRDNWDEMLDWLRDEDKT